VDKYVIVDDSTGKRKRGGKVAVSFKQSITLISGDITNGYVNLSHEILANTLFFIWNGVTYKEGVHYTLSTVSSVTRVTFAGELISGNTLLVAGDILDFQYEY
jgi:hypothetical protein